MIEDAYTGEVRPVANVPLGVAATGGIISRIGYGITELFEQGYSDPVRITDNGFLEPLQALNTVMNIAYGAELLNAVDADIGGYTNIRQSMINYIKECTAVKILTGETTSSANSVAKIMDGIRYNSSVHGTKIYIDASSQQGDELTCSEAANKLVLGLDRIGYKSFSKLNELLNLDPTYMTAEMKISNGLQMLNQTGTSSTDFVKLALLVPLYEEGMKHADLFYGGYNSGLMISEAVMQRNVQWAGEASMFMTVVHPMITFFEAFIYAISPIVAIMLVMGAVGMSIAVKYFQTALWIQLWMPVLSIINLYMTIMVSEGMAGPTEFQSIYAYGAASIDLPNYIATGGMLAAATPAISLLITQPEMALLHNLVTCR
ncbi:conjugal transfer protein TraG N-terminal domain-containing protein, partial [Roseibium sp. RKSG952]|uniref:conjugal transfer protein TraG N-terminal domain-containing protein n=1 Tax=Roseibium sp. RKSG952 TaxID=2529384 RepID=UPI0013C5DF71|nr:conjugal transfer protein TraG [Roseibium sp. RKSG952]